MSSAGWRTGGSSVRGGAHARRGAPNQDAYMNEPGAQASARFMIAVADGHGGNPHFRSEVGAEIAIEALREALEWSIDEPDQLPGLATDLVEIWRKRVLEHLASHPLENNRQTFTPYGTTLVAVAGTAQVMVALQIGDGDLVLGYSSGRLERPLPADLGLVGEQTYSLCMDNAPEFVKYRVLRPGEDWPDFALVATDGVGKSFVNDNAFLDVVRHYRELNASEDDLAATQQALPDWLQEVSDNGSADDATLCFATRRFGESGP